MESGSFFVGWTGADTDGRALGCGTTPVVEIAEADRVVP